MPPSRTKKAQTKAAVATASATSPDADVGAGAGAQDEVVLSGTVHKFRQNEALREKLFATGEREIAESSPRDKIWGIGMGESKAVAVGREKWAGLNLLGKALVRARTVLRDEFGEVPEKD